MQKIVFNDNWNFSANDGRSGVISLPHDAMITGKRAADAPTGSALAFFQGGSYVYEKTFTRPQQSHVVFEFEGVYKNAKVFINGTEAGGVAYGYLPFFVEADKYLVEGENTIRVECENMSQPDSRWYTGAGIYRPVWMWTGEQAHILPQGVKVTTLSYAPAKIQVEVASVGEGCTATVAIYDGSELIAEKEATASVEFDIANAKLWSEDTPHLYHAVVTLKQGEKVVDKTEVKFGIRKVEWSNKGLFINGNYTLLRGGCVHHDNGILGAATYDKSEYRRVRKMKEAGYNAIRSSHNPTSRALLEACDYYGMYVMDESWDMWFHHKCPYDYAKQWRENYLSDLKAMVERDYNHPSVIMYSIGNEVSEPAKEEGVKVTKEMVEYLHNLDSTRPVTGGFNLMIIANAKKGKGIYDEENGGRKEDNDKSMNGMNSTMFNLITSMVGTGMNKSANSKAADEATSPCLDSLDMAGYNYASGRYEMDGKLHPNRLIYGSETFPHDIAKNWEMVKKYPYLIGDFMWTAWDYLGEAGLGAWAYTPDGKGFNKPYPWLLADCGAMDILGNPNAELFHASAVWNQLEAPAITVQPVNHPGATPAKGAWRGSNALPTWSWRNCDGNKAIVEVYTDAAVVEVILNGKSLGKKKVKGCKVTYKTKYQSGRIEAVAYDGAGREISRSELTSAKGATKITLTPEEKEIAVGDICYIDVAITDANGILEANADTKLKVSVEGGELLAFGSANPRTEEVYQSGQFTTYYGKALAVVKATQAGELKVRVAGMDVSEASAVIAVN